VSSLINDDAKIVGVHIQGGCKEVGTGYNKGTPINSIRDASGVID
jgi:hypothetical protein